MKIKLWLFNVCFGVQATYFPLGSCDFPAFSIFHLLWKATVEQFDLQCSCVLVAKAGFYLP
jgi:hypothetical protein